MAYSEAVTSARQCSKPGCAREAVATLTYDYQASTAVLGPLATAAEPHTYDLCDTHQQHLTAPRGWQIVRLQTHFEPAPPSQDDLMALADAVRQAAAARAAEASPRPTQPEATIYTLPTATQREATLQQQAPSPHQASRTADRNAHALRGVEFGPFATPRSAHTTLPADSDNSDAEQGSGIVSTGAPNGGANTSPGLGPNEPSTSTNGPAPIMRDVSAKDTTPGPSDNPLDPASIWAQRRGQFRVID